jgi:hypothetical protein
MKRFITILLSIACIILISSISFAQSTHTIDFEPAGVGATWSWTVTENDDNPPFEFIANPVSGGINTSATVAKFIARQTGQQWALCFTDDDGEFTFDASNSIVKIMVYKPDTSVVGMKFEGLSPAIELHVSNTLTNQWEELTFDFSGQIGNTYSRIVIIPDFAPRSQDHTIYFDNVQVPDGVVSGPLPEPTAGAPTPTHPAANVLSIYSDAYDNLPNVNYNPNWGQSTAVTVNYVIAGDSTLKYENLNYQGTEFTNQDVSGYDYFHVDFWTPNSTSLEFYLISTGPQEKAYTLPITTEQWVGVDIPLSHFSPPVDLTDVFQFKVVGNGTVYFDNWYFYKTATGIGDVSGSVPLNFDLEQNYPNPFNPVTQIKFSIPAANQVTLKVYNMLGQEVATLVNEYKNAGTYQVSFDAASLPSGAYIYSISAGNYKSAKKMLLLK